MWVRVWCPVVNSSDLYSWFLSPQFSLCLCGIQISILMDLSSHSSKAYTILDSSKLFIWHFPHPLHQRLGKSFSLTSPFKAHLCEWFQAKNSLVLLQIRVIFLSIRLTEFNVFLHPSSFSLQECTLVSLTVELFMTIQEICWLRWTASLYCFVHFCTLRDAHSHPVQIVDTLVIWYLIIIGALSFTQEFWVGM